jgi:hypothetical protein
MAIGQNGQIKTAAVEARQFADDVLERLDKMADAVSNLKHEIAEDEFALVRANAVADAAGAVEIVVMDVPAGAVWLLDRVSIVAVRDMVTPGLYLNRVGNDSLIEIPYFLNGSGSPIQATFAAGWTIKGPARVLFSTSGQDAGDMTFAHAMVRMLGGTE